MIHVQLVDLPLIDIKTRSLALFVAQNEEFSAEVKELAKEFFPQLQTYIAEQNFHGALGSVLAITVSKGDHIVTLFLVGLGKKEHDVVRSAEQVRRAVGSLIKALQVRKIGSCAMHIPQAQYFKLGNQYFGRHVTIAAQMVYK